MPAAPLPCRREGKSCPLWAFSVSAPSIGADVRVPLWGRGTLWRGAWSASTKGGKRFEVGADRWPCALTVDLAEAKPIFEQNPTKGNRDFALSVCFVAQLVRHPLPAYRLVLAPPISQTLPARPLTSMVADLHFHGVCQGRPSGAAKRPTVNANRALCYRTTYPITGSTYRTVLQAFVITAPCRREGARRVFEPISNRLLSCPLLFRIRLPGVFALYQLVPL